MALDPTPESHPQLFAIVKYHIDYYHESGEYVSKRGVEKDIRKDYNYRDLLVESGLDPSHENAERSFRRVLWPVVRYYMRPSNGWWAKSYGRAAVFFHESFGTPEDGRDSANLRIRDRETDAVALKRILSFTEAKCGQLGWTFDPQYDVDTGALERVEVWKSAA